MKKTEIINKILFSNLTLAACFSGALGVCAANLSSAHTQLSSVSPASTEETLQRYTFKKIRGASVDYSEMLSADFVISKIELMKINPSESSDEVTYSKDYFDVVVGFDIQELVQNAAVTDRLELIPTTYNLIDKQNYKITLRESDSETDPALLRAAENSRQGSEFSLHTRPQLEKGLAINAEQLAESFFSFAQKVSAMSGDFVINYYTNESEEEPEIGADWDSTLDSNYFDCESLDATCKYKSVVDLSEVPILNVPTTFILSNFNLPGSYDEVSRNQFKILMENRYLFRYVNQAEDIKSFPSVQLYNSVGNVEITTKGDLSIVARKVVGDFYFGHDSRPVRDTQAATRTINLKFDEAEEIYSYAGIDIVSNIYVTNFVPEARDASQTTQSGLQLNVDLYGMARWKGNLIIDELVNINSVNIVNKDGRGTKSIILQRDWHVDYPLSFVKGNRVHSEGAPMIIKKDPDLSESSVNPQFHVNNDMRLGLYTTLQVEVPFVMESDGKLIFVISDRPREAGRLKIDNQGAQGVVIPSADSIQVIPRIGFTWDNILAGLENLGDGGFIDLIEVYDGSLVIRGLEESGSSISIDSGALELVLVELRETENRKRSTILRLQLNNDDTEEGSISGESEESTEEVVTTPGIAGVSDDVESQSGSIAAAEDDDAEESDDVESQSGSVAVAEDDDAEKDGGIREVQVLASDSASEVVSSANTDSGMKQFALFNGVWSDLPSTQGKGDFAISGNVGASFYAGSALKGKAMSASVNGGYLWDDVALDISVQYVHTIFGNEKQHFVSSIAAVSYYKDAGLRGGGYLGGGGTVVVPAEQKLGALLMGGNLAYQVRFDDIPQAPMLGIDLLAGGKTDMALAFTSGNMKKPVVHLNGEVGLDATFTYLDRKQLPDLTLSLRLPLKSKFGMIYDPRGQADKYTLVPAFKSGLELRVSYQETYNFKVGYEVELSRQYVRNGVSFGLQFSK